MQKQKYYSLKNIQKIDADYNIILGERSNGKSFAVKNNSLKDAYDDPINKKFVYLRRWDYDLKSGLTEQYFNDAQVSLITNEKFNCIRYYNGRLFFANRDNKDETPQLCGYARALSMEEHYVSGNYDDVSNIIYEEFISRTNYVVRETMKLQHFVSTVARRRRIKVWLVGNTLSRMCPYFTEWELINVPKQKQGTIDIYNHKTDQLDDDGNPIEIKIAVEYAENSGNNSRMFFGSTAKMITSGVWQSEEKPHLPKNKQTGYYIQYSIIVCNMGFKYLCQFLIDKETGAAMWYVEPKTTDIKKTDRIITDTYDLINSITTRGFKALDPAENIAFSYLYNHTIFYSDNLTGTDFEAAIKRLTSIEI